MKDGKLLRIGGFISGGVLIVFGIVVIALGIYGIHFTRDSIKQEGIVFGPATDPAVAEHAEKWAGEPVETGSQALAFAEIMRHQTLPTAIRPLAPGTKLAGPAYTVSGRPSDAPADLGIPEQ